MASLAPSNMPQEYSLWKVNHCQWVTSHKNKIISGNISAVPVMSARKNTVEIFGGDSRNTRDIQFDYLE
jgi:hypothetical protein